MMAHGNFSRREIPWKESDTLGIIIDENSNFRIFHNGNVNMSGKVRGDMGEIFVAVSLIDGCQVRLIPPVDLLPFVTSVREAV